MKKLPPIPKTVHSLLGPVPVKIVADLRDPQGRQLFGKWDSEKREISLDDKMCLTTAWSTLWHERVHVMLSDAGVRLKPNKAEDVCNAVALALTADMLA